MWIQSLEPVRLHICGRAGVHFAIVILGCCTVRLASNRFLASKSGQSIEVSLCYAFSFALLTQ